ncbi:MAG TPA: alpha-galactosidase [Spirochaetota bacterium]|nr:alpha-galactosidase [Spirochaetota bacterium]
MILKNGIIKYIKNGKKINSIFQIENQTIESEDFLINISIKKSEKSSISYVAITPKIDITIVDFVINCEYSFDQDDRILTNGFQSWSTTNELGVNDSLKPFPFFLKPLINPHKLKYYGDYTFVKYYNQKGKFHSFNYTYIKDKNSNYNFLGSLNEEVGYTIFYFDTKKRSIVIKKDCSDLAISNHPIDLKILNVSGNYNDIFKEYFNKLGIDRIKQKPLTGWTSWYNYYTNITEEIILNNLENFAKQKILIDVYQIDDGYQKSVGDWLVTNSKFPSGMKKIVEKIKSNGYKAGLWLAPFICEENSDIFRNHKDWLLKDKKSKYVYGGNNKGWSGPFYALDLYNKEFRNYLKEVFSLILDEWGFDMVKLDFLYAVSIIPRNDKSRGEVISDAMTFLRSLVKDKMILGCGVPLANSFGLVEYCRIGCDVALQWEDKTLKNINFRERVSTHAAINDTIFRRGLNGFAFYNDPDVFFLRDENISLNAEQKYTLLLTNLIFGGLVFTSDNIANYDSDKLKLFLSIFPHKDKNITNIESSNDFHKIMFNINEKEYVAYVNLCNYSKSIQTDDNEYFYNGAILSNNSRIDLKPFQSVCLYKIKNSNFEVIGTTGHIFATSEIKTFVIKENQATIEFYNNFVNTNKVFIKIPDSLDAFVVNDNKIIANKIENHNVIVYCKE